MDSCIDCRRFPCFFPAVFFIFTAVLASTDTLLINQTFSDNQTLVSANGFFELGFFSPGNSSVAKRYLGIWYTFSKKTVVWVANRESPIDDTSGVLVLSTDGKLTLRNADNFPVWVSSPDASITPRNPVAQMLDSGNFVLKQGDDVLWQSFDHISNTLLATAKLGKNLVTGADNYFSSWRSESDPSPGDTVYRIDTNGYPQMFMTVKQKIVFRSGPWNGLSFAGVNTMRPNSIFSYQVVYNDDEIYYRFELLDNTTFSRLLLRDPGNVSRFIWSSKEKQWGLYSSVAIDDCDTFAKCGPFGRCTFNKTASCDCLEGFDPKNPMEWKDGNWSGGCERRNHLLCGRSDDLFARIDGVKLPDTRTSWFNKTMRLSQCQIACSGNCSCKAYATIDITVGTGCLLWFDDLLDIRQFNGDGQTLYLRLGQSRDSDKHKKGIVAPWIVAPMVLVGLLCYIFYWRRRQRGTLLNQGFDDGEEFFDLPSLDFSVIDRATDSFSFSNKLGEGGFGHVFKGVMDDGQEIAVKRLSKNSCQGMSEFMNEVSLIAKLQHRNLVRLLGCCIHLGERLLIYELMPNKSLDYFIYDETKRKLLGWEHLIDIIGGIAKGLLYLHQDSRLRIIHRDLKASNVLLDSEMNPKISDFGMARMFRADQHSANTMTVVGTYGYMAPEYAVHGEFSTKSDVFSFGVLVLEILSGKRNRAFSHPDHGHNLLGHVWKLWMEERAAEFIDGEVMEPEMRRCIHVGLLCVQHRPEERPNMASVVLMLENDGVLPQPSKPGFFAERTMPTADSLSRNRDSISTNEISITLPLGR